MTKKDNQNTPTNNPKNAIIILALLTDNDDGKKLIKEYCDGIKLAIKLVETEAIIKNINTKIVTNKLSILPTISVGFVSILERLPCLVSKMRQLL